jgi:hypothetical protein
MEGTQVAQVMVQWAIFVDNFESHIIQRIYRLPKRQLAYEEGT